MFLRRKCVNHQSELSLFSSSFPCTEMFEDRQKNSTSEVRALHNGSTQRSQKNLGSRRCGHYKRHKSKDSDKSRYLAAKDEFTNETDLQQVTVRDVH